MNALSISRSCPLQSANFASEEFSAFLSRRPGLQPWRETIAFQWALAPEVRLRFTLIDGTRLQTLRRCSGRSSDRFFLLFFLGKLSASLRYLSVFPSETRHSPLATRPFFTKVSQ